MRGRAQGRVNGPAKGPAGPPGRRLRPPRAANDNRRPLGKRLGAWAALLLLATGLFALLLG